MSSLYLALLSAAFVVIQCLAGGTRLLYSLPAYGLLALAACLSMASIRGAQARPSGYCLLATALCFTYLLIRSICSPVASLARADLFSIIGCLMVYLLVVFYLTKATHRLAILGLLLGIAGAEVVVGLIQFTRDGNFMLFGFVRGKAGYSASGMFLSYNHFAGYLEMVGVMALSIAIWGRTKLWVRILIGYGAVVCYVGVAIAGSRGGYLSTLCSLVAFTILSLCASALTGRDKTIVASVLTVVLLVFGTAMATRLMSQSFQLGQKMEKIVTDDIRPRLWAAAKDQFHLSPVFGTGAGTYLRYGRLFRRPSVESDPVHVHNDYLELLAEYGVVGATGMFVFLLTHAVSGLSAVVLLTRRSLVAHEHGSNELAFEIGALSGIVALLAHSVVDFNLHIPGNALVCAFFFAIVANPGTGNVGVPAPPQAFAGWFRFALPALGLWVLGMGVWQTLQFWRADLSLSARGAWSLAMVMPGFPGEYYAEEARVALRDGDFAKCADVAETGIRYETENPSLYFYLGEANRGYALKARGPGLRSIQLARLEAAVNAYRSGLKLFPQDIQLLLRLAQCLDSMKRFDEADSVYLEALKHDPNLPLLHAHYGVHLEKTGRMEEAEGEFRRARETYHLDINALLQELRRP